MKCIKDELRIELANEARVTFAHIANQIAKAIHNGNIEELQTYQTDFDRYLKEYQERLIQIEFAD